MGTGSPGPAPMSTRATSSSRIRRPPQTRAAGSDSDPRSRPRPCSEQEVERQHLAVGQGLDRIGVIVHDRGRLHDETRHEREDRSFPVGVTAVPMRRLIALATVSMMTLLGLVAVTGSAQAASTGSNGQIASFMLGARSPAHAQGGTLHPSSGATPSCEGQPATIVGTQGADIINGTAGNDVIVSLGGDDLVRGLAGDDLICAGAGNDIAYGGPRGATVSTVGAGTMSFGAAPGPLAARPAGLGTTGSTARRVEATTLPPGQATTLSSGAARELIGCISRMPRGRSTQAS